MKLSVIILNYNVRFFLEQCLISVKRALKGMDAEIIVVDNASVDDSCAMVKDQFPEVKLLQNKENLGFSIANNLAAAAAKGEYLCILNPDTAVAEDTFVKCLEYIESTQKIGALGIYYMDGTGNFLPESKRNLPTPKRSLLKFLGYSRGKNGYYAKYLQEKGEGTVEILAGAFMLLRRDLYVQVGGFDEDYFMYGEDIDLCYKISKQGLQNHYYGNVSLLHYKGESTQRDTHYLNRFYGAMHIFYRKHFSKNPLLNALVFGGIAVTKFFKKHKKEKHTKHYLDEVWVLTENLNFLRAISELFELPVKSVAKRAVEEDLVSNKMLVFDADYLPYKSIFEFMQKQKNRDNSFRIKPPGRNFIIGSDQSDMKGEVHQLNL
ncbi:MAG TPA: glycosyltransferase family 2 protein [Flavobacteriaceae bacterium]|nr:glycosyltransferase family 2 protein [Flavobacteriaceae bacterium]HPF11626.1 glycosyltransferase family 2 protein [Flavobacteriaceae bacterium]HQU20101.1 glycosyltransferase family 2 protein [Flavobacteriaceae bacterium]HQU64810.1 glycosyltransferase family 2 protein [Flavobacteriaceae bacterium]HRW43472.1 glycosyltransferase family 2 protein [Flavobacteriaceae bacterium]